jgi:hypothetical protein
VAVECPNTNNLRLGTNFKYRDIILAAGNRSGYKPQAIAAIMNAEAATIVTTELLPVIGKDGNPVIDKKTGRPKVRKLTRNTGEREIGVPAVVRARHDTVSRWQLD